MQLRVISNYGAYEMLVSDSVSLEQVRSKMVDLDWNSFHQVVLEQENGDWIEVGGNLLDDGLSAMYQEAGRQYEIRQTPKSVDQLTEILLSYLRGDNKFREDHKFH
ncbi:MAG: hypothetical protein R8G66_31360 [Cytophagales bacterium]|nr:hypothetical protein [Cytophagales bacterium]